MNFALLKEFSPKITSIKKTILNEINNFHIFTDIQR